MVVSFSLQRKASLSKRKQLAFFSFKNYNVKRKQRNAQMKIQQMMFMILAVFFFFMLVGLFFIVYQSGGLRQSIEYLEKEQALSSIKVITGMSELKCNVNELCLDEDKLKVMQNRKGYDDFWPVASIEVYKTYPVQEKYTIYNSNQKNVRKLSSFVSICKETDWGDDCEIGKILIGVRLQDE